MSSASVAEALDALEDRIGEFDRCGYSSAGGQAARSAGERFRDSVVIGVTDAERGQEPGFAGPFDEDPGPELGGFNQWTQHRLAEIVVAR